MLNERNLYIVLTSCILKVPSDVCGKNPKKDSMTRNSTKMANEFKNLLDDVVKKP